LDIGWLPSHGGPGETPRCTSPVSIAQSSITFSSSLRSVRLLAWFRKKGSPLNLVVNLDVPDEIILARISDRWVHLPSGRVYNLSYNRPRVDGIDDQTGEPLTKRPDDNPVRYGGAKIEIGFNKHVLVTSLKGNFCSPTAGILFIHFATLGLLQFPTDSPFPRLESKSCFATRWYIRRNMATIRACSALGCTRS